MDFMLGARYRILQNVYWEQCKSEKLLFNYKVPQRKSGGRGGYITDSVAASRANFPKVCIEWERERENCSLRSMTRYRRTWSVRTQTESSCKNCSQPTAAQAGWPRPCCRLLCCRTRLTYNCCSLPRDFQFGFFPFLPRNSQTNKSSGLALSLLRFQKLCHFFMNHHWLKIES